MNNFSNWNNAINELESARSMFNHAETKYHTDLAIKAINLAEEKLNMLREAHEINYVPSKSQDIQQETLLQKVIRKGKEVLLHAE